jgi:hypothetical protein
MERITKIVLSIPSVLGFGYMFTFWFPQDFHWLVPSMEAYYVQVGTLQALTITQMIILLRKLWSFKNIENSKKSEWTWLLILFNSITSLIFIWKRVDQFEALNNQVTLKNKQDSEL